MQFRDCLEADLPIVQNYSLSLYREGTPEREISPDNIKKTFQEFITRPEKGRIIVFESNGVKIGYAILVFFWSNEFGGDVVEIDELFVQQDYRNCGIATTFFRWLETEFADTSVAFGLQTTPANVRAAALYQRVGFVLSQNLHFSKFV